MNTRALALAATCCVLAAAAHAGEDLSVQPGKWEIRTETKNSMMPTPQVVERTECVTDGEWDPDTLTKDLDDGCEVGKVASSADRLQWELTCATPGGQMVGKGDYRSSGDRVEGSMNMEMTAGSMRITAESVFTGKRVGDCD